MTSLDRAAPALAARGQPAGAAGSPAALVLGCGVAAYLSLLLDRLLADPDTHWHVAVGAWIWRTGAWPVADAFSHTFAGQPWIAKEWLSQIILFGAHALGGWTAVALLACASVAASFALLFRELALRMPAIPALAVTLVALTMASPQFLARPHILTYPILVLWTAALAEAAERRAAPPWRLVALMALWANLHAGYTLGFVVAGLLGAEAVLGAAPRDRVRLALRWALVGAACLGAACLTPYGARTLVITATMFGSGEAVSRIAEWRPAGPDLQGAVAVGALAAAVACLLGAPRRNLFRLLAVAACGYLMLRHMRFAGPFAIVAAILAAPSAARWLPARRVSPAPADPRLPAAAAGLAALALAAALLRPPEPSPLTTPEAALRAARTLGLASGRVYNSYGFGGYLLAQGVPTFIDGRTDQLFVGGFMAALERAQLGEGGAGVVRFVEPYGVTWAILARDAPEAAQFEAAPGWRRVYLDGTASVFARD